MDFINAWAIGIGALALGAPVAVHLLTKPKPVPFALSTVRFLQEVIQQRRAKSRLRDWLILLLRTICVALLALTLARPLIQQPPAVPMAAEKNAQRVIVVDSSQSMSAGSGGVTSWSSAVASALQYLDSSTGLQAAVIFAGAKPHPVFETLSPNLVALREALKQAKPLSEGVDPRAAMEQAANILKKSNAGAKELVIISDFQRTNWGTPLLDLVPKDTRVQFHSVTQAITANVAIHSVRFSSDPVVGQTVVMEIELANFSDTEVTVRCSIDLKPLKRTFETAVQPQSSRTLSEAVSFDEVGWKHGWAKLESNLDVLPLDDTRPIAVRVRPPVHVLMVSRQNAKEIPSSSFYMQQALNVALTTRAEDAVVVRVHSSRDPLRSWPPCDIYVLDHPGSMSNESLQLIASQLRRGKGLLYVTSELVDAVNLQKLSEILGSEFQPPVELVPENGNEVRKDLFVRQVKSREPPFNVLGSNNAAALLKPVRFQGGLGTRATTSGLRDQVLAELSDTSALLYLSSVGAGQIAVLNTDLARSNWSVQPTFLPIVSELAKSLLTQRAQSDQMHSGEPIVRNLPASVTDSTTLSARAIDGPLPYDGDFGRWQWVASQGSVVWKWPEPPGPGIYALEENSTPVWMVATSAPALESDLSCLDEKILTERVSGERSVGFASANSQNEKPDDLWKWLIIGCLLGLVAETLALRWSQM